MRGKGDASAHELIREAFVSSVMNGVVVTHHGQRNTHLELTCFFEDAHWSDASVECALRCLLDDWAVHHRIRERNADLDGVGARIGGSTNGLLPTGESARYIGHQELAALVALGAELGFHASETHQPKISII